MACNCFEKTAALFKQHISAKVGDALGEIEEAGFEHSLYNFHGGDHSPVALNFQFRYYRKRKGGGLATNKTKLDHLCIMSYCPLCGTKFEGDGIQTEASND
ncbi:hypothetical protein [Serratia rhizosphaerae]|uniref:Uncharacterized protein n=1 Tax=Serratia rhizosphaerae TaxID=2597702 RepID=A0ABX6GH53_9GAMM|nr:hypothetical protein [Serratia rhizosphaerae]QHA85575.1 hypothetical protein FO014_00490 [Serratia rhizosphaerae]